MLTGLVSIESLSKKSELVLKVEHEWIMVAVSLDR